MKIKITASAASQFKTAPKEHTIYTCGYFVRDSRDGWTYIVDFPVILMSSDYETIFDVYFESEDAVKNAAA